MLSPNEEKGAAEVQRTIPEREPKRRHSCGEAWHRWKCDQGAGSVQWGDFQAGSSSAHL